MIPIDLANIRNITVSGRIGAGTTTLAKGLADALGWEVFEGGEIFAQIHQSLKLSELEVSGRPDSFDVEYEEKIKEMLKDKKHQVIQSHLSGFDAQGIDGVFKILVLCEDDKGNDKIDIRIDRLVNRRKISVEEAKEEVRLREEENLTKWRRLYANSDKNWINWDKKYYDLVINTYINNPQQSLAIALKAIGYID
ncbi:MAG: hypothetical protein HYV37_00485 [Candidatus Levyibacteriota bacterium]|nr:MAG: hypothetical protein HYV37_00485 [Candidatus Levybacteria bacterium]